jgi:hypothetical protein
MASKFVVNAAFETRPLIRPSHQRTVLSGNTPSLADPRCRRFPAPGYTQTLLPLLHFQKSSGSTKSSQSSGPEDKNRFHPKGWVKGRAALTALAGGLGLIGVVRAGSFSCHLKYADYQRVFSYMPLSQLVI